MKHRPSSVLLPKNAINTDDYNAPLQETESETPDDHNDKTDADADPLNNNTLEQENRF